MRRKLFIVEDTFEIKGRGLEICGKDISESPVNIKVGETLIIVKPNNEEILVPFLGFAMFNPPNFGVLSTLIQNLKKSDVPIGSEVFVKN